MGRHGSNPPCRASQTGAKSHCWGAGALVASDDRFRGRLDMVQAAKFGVICYFAAFAAGAVTEPVAEPGAAPATPDTTVFPRPAVLAPNVAFWTEAFSYYSEYQSVIHSQVRPEKIYVVLDFRDDAVRLGPAGARR